MSCSTFMSDFVIMVTFYPHYVLQHQYLNVYIFINVYSSKLEITILIKYYLFESCLKFHSQLRFNMLELDFPITF